MLFAACGSLASAEPQADPASGAQTGASAASPAGDSQTALPQGGFFSSIKQALKKGFDTEVVRGHFEQGSPPNARRYYCLVDPKTGQREPNGVLGEPKVLPDGMTGLQGSTVSLYSCDKAEQQGILVTDGYKIGAVASRAAPQMRVAAPAAPAPAAPAPAAPPPSVGAPPMPPAVAPSAPPVMLSAAAGEVLAPIHQFIDGFNVGDVQSAYAAYAPGDITIVDEFAPHRWVGPKAPQAWAADFDKHARATGVSDGMVKYGAPTRAEVEGDVAYVIIPTVYLYKQHGQATAEEGQMTFVLHSSGKFWKIVSWTWSGVPPHPKN